MTTTLTALCALALLLALVAVLRALTATVTMTIAAGGETLSTAVAVTGEALVEFEYAVAGTTADQQFACNILYTNLQALYIEYKDSTGAHLGGTIETNSSSAPTDTITLTAGKGPLCWVVGSGLAKPLTGNITASIFVTPGSATAGTIKIKAVYND